MSRLASHKIVAQEARPTPKEISAYATTQLTGVYVTPRPGPVHKQSKNTVLIIQGKGGGTAHKEVDAARLT